MGKFVISQRANGEYQFNLKAGEGQVVLKNGEINQEEIKSINREQPSN